MMSPLVAVASRAALYPIQSIILIALFVSGAYFHLLEIARNAPGSDSSSAVSPDYGTSITSPLMIWGRKHNTEWKWTLDPIPESDTDVFFLVYHSNDIFRLDIFVSPGVN
jgi:hypothetical protein